MTKVNRPRAKVLGARRLAELTEQAAALVEDGHCEGSMLFELIDELDRMSGRERTSDRYAKERGWQDEEASDDEGRE